MALRKPVIGDTVTITTAGGVEASGEITDEDKAYWQLETKQSWICMIKADVVKVKIHKPKSPDNQGLKLKRTKDKEEEEAED